MIKELQGTKGEKENRSSISKGTTELEPMGWREGLQLVGKGVDQSDRVCVFAVWEEQNNS